LNTSPSPSPIVGSNPKMMTIKEYFILLLTSIFTFCSCRSNTSQIQHCFNDFKAAIMRNNGEAAVNLVDSSTIKFYSTLLDKAENLDSLQLEKESMITKFEVFKIRLMITPMQVNQINGRRLLTMLINHGISGNGNIKSYTLGHITIRNDSAEAEKLSNNKRTPFIYLFSKENDFWKIRMTSSNTTTDIAFKQLAIDEGLTDNDYIYKLLEEIFRKKPSNDIWKPIN
jgi:hypothetical protein